MATPSSKSQQHTSTQTEPKTLTNEPIAVFDDGVSEVVQLTNGVRCHRCGDALMIVSRQFDQTDFIARDNATWRWSIWSEDGEATKRGDAEADATKRLQPKQPRRQLPLPDPEPAAASLKSITAAYSAV